MNPAKGGAPLQIDTTGDWVWSGKPFSAQLSAGENTVMIAKREGDERGACLIIVLVVNNGVLSLIRQNQKYALGFRYGVDLWYDGHYPDVVTISKGFGCYAERVQHPDEIRPAFQRAVGSGKPSVIDIIVDQGTDAAMGASLDAIKEFD